ncbi:hypothetical protein CANARDRAFT_5044 [[Candida] arabinofermentans NRRL YB-2248]|uniref:Phosphate transporter n=1 Tax=[Candida] arabinofermentans NRRL YB-2248 TaxID=983967 RepID=A0A1E4T7J5_9ASCO|nr:hypothetical protein CANARDRAFT_5044 [[Candida] arabinofermentans NRRL YB-2248]
MIRLEQFDYIFAIGMLFAFLDAFNIGANDVANSFSSSISSKSLTYFQAMCLASICEFLGAVLAGSRVSDTIRTKIVDLDAFKDSPAALMITMACALIGSSIWLTIATAIGMPVSTTHSISGGLIGAGIAAVGSDNIIWGWSGFSQMVAAWFIAPLLGGCISAIIFSFVKFGIMERKNDVKRALLFAPVVVFVTFAILTMLITWKGAPNLNLDDLSTGAIVGSIFGVGASASVIYMIFIHPIFQRRLIHEDWRIPFWHALFGFTYYFKSKDDIPPVPEGRTLIPDYYEGRRINEDTDLIHQESEGTQEIAMKNAHKVMEIEIKKSQSLSDNQIEAQVVPKLQALETVGTTEENVSIFRYVTPEEYDIWKIFIKKPSKWPMLFLLIITHGFRQDVISNQSSSDSTLGKNVNNVHSKSIFYNIKAEHVFSLLQAVTACTMSFAHGSNDIANAAGPLSTIYLVWKSNTTTSKLDVPVWVLCFTAGALVIGLWTFGYKIVSQLGNKMILQSPCRGFSIELGAAVTVVMATQLNIPVSTTQIATGCTVAVGLCNLNLQGCNWRMVAWCYLGWVITIPIAGLMAGILNGIIINAPRMGAVYEMSG